jgi:hypothetical protein
MFITQQRLRVMLSTGGADKGDFTKKRERQDLDENDQLKSRKEFDAIYFNRPTVLPDTYGGLTYGYRTIVQYLFR